MPRRSEERGSSVKTSRRHFLETAGLLALGGAGCVHVSHQSKGVLVNDVQSRLNPTYVDRILKTDSLQSLQLAIRRAADRERMVPPLPGGVGEDLTPKTGTKTLSRYSAALWRRIQKLTCTPQKTG